MRRLASSPLILLVSLLAVAALSACGDGIQERSDTDPTPDMTGDTPPSDVPNDQGDVPTDSGDMQPDMLPMGKAPGGFTNCATTADCQSGVCLDSVCVSDPTEYSYITVEEDGVLEFPSIPPEVACYASGSSLDPNEGVTAAPLDQRVTAWGEVERFGPGSSTFDVCITFYDQDRLLNFLDDSDCNDMPASEERLDCFQADPCRCDELTGAAQTDCYKSIGLCDVLTGADQAECEANLPGGQLIYGYGKTICEDGNGTEIGCSDAGVRIYYRIPNIPVNRDMVVKASGLELRWVDTFEYNVLLPWNKVTTDVTDPVTGDTNTFKFEANVISVGAWNTIPTTAGLPFPIDRLERGAIAGRLLDCGLEGRSAADPMVPALDNPQAMVHSTMGLAVRADGTPDRISYFNGNPDDSLPDPGRVDANLLGVYSALNVPYGKNRLVVRTDFASAPAGGECVDNGSGGSACLGGSFDLFSTPYSVTIATPEGRYMEVE